MATDEFIQHLWDMGPTFTDATPHSKKLGIKFVAVDKGRATMSLPYNTDLIGDPDTRVLHGGAVTTLLDQACGLGRRPYRHRSSHIYGNKFKTN